MADDRSRLEKLLNMLAADDMTALVAVRKIRDMAQAEKKTVGELCMSGRVVYQDRVVYRERERPANERPRTRQEHDDFAKDFTDAFRRGEDVRAEMRRKAREAREAEKAERNKHFYGAFDDAEMSDEEREATRATRGKTRESRFTGSRAKLDLLIEALETDDKDLTYWEIDFCQTVPHQYAFDWELSRKQNEVADRIIRKMKRNREGSPI